MTYAAGVRRFRVLAPIAVLLLLLSSAAAREREREPDPQRHELRLDLDISVANLANSALFDGQYTFTPGALNRHDEVVPALRRFVRHPSTLWLRVMRDGSSIDTRTGLHAGASGELLGGRLFGALEAGVERDEVNYDPRECGYDAAPFALEAGGRPAPLVALGAFYRGRPTIGATECDPPNAERSGWEHELGGTFGVATSEDRLFVQLHGGYHVADWTFARSNPGTLTVSGARGGVRLLLQSSARLSWLFQATVSRETWDDRRPFDDIEEEVPKPLERDVVDAVADLGITYWHQGRLGFRFSVGGGYDGEKPIYNGKDRGVIRFGFGVVSRY
jgi:hypothetical protein